MLQSWLESTAGQTAASMIEHIYAGNGFWSSFSIVGDTYGYFILNVLCIIAFTVVLVPVEYLTIKNLIYTCHNFDNPRDPDGLDYTFDIILGIFATVLICCTFALIAEGSVRLLALIVKNFFTILPYHLLISSLLVIAITTFIMMFKSKLTLQES